MALASGVAVAVAVIAVALSAYEGISTQLNGQLDSSLRSIAAGILARAHMPPGGPGHGAAYGGQGGSSAGGGSSSAGGGSYAAGGGGSSAADGPPSQAERLHDPDEGLNLDGGNGPAFGAAPGVAALVRANGTVYRPPGENGAIPIRPADRALAATGRGSAFSDRTARGVELRVLATGIGPGLGALLVALPLTDVERTLHRQLLLLAVISALGVALAAALGLLVARTALAPIQRFTRQTEAIAQNPERLETERVDVRSRDELGRLAQTFNRTLDALAAAVRAQRNLVADASHELRTPIASIRANLQLMRDEQRLTEEDRAALRRDVIQELDDLTALVGDVVELARGSQPQAERADVRLDEIVEAAVARARRRAAGIAFETELEPTLVHGEGERIARAIANLLDNAAKYGAEGGVVRVTLRDGVVTVADRGPGFRAEDLPFVFDRFHRARDARGKPGSGLGLAIVRQAAEAHGGYAQAANAPDGGAVLRVCFGEAIPLLADPDAAPSPGA
ncbi:MAG TPA: HAMP domain-containing sensor histidine kinase [Solirubrobacteraceae bacterium]|nr:HAMP domain-containing sensor histidine kinase [Solirubrobacteraceae bacterium]